jgi:CDGSH-type Zn-finger protein
METKNSKEVIKSLAKGPVKLPGDFTIIEHSELKCVRGGDTTTALICRCGNTKTPPVCSGAHETDPDV